MLEKIRAGGESFLSAGQGHSEAGPSYPSLRQRPLLSATGVPSCCLPPKNQKRSIYERLRKIKSAGYGYGDAKGIPQAWTGAQLAPHIFKKIQKVPLSKILNSTIGDWDRLGQDEVDRAGLGGRLVDLVGAKLIVEIGPADLEQTGGVRAVAGGLAQGFLDAGPFGLLRGRAADRAKIDVRRRGR